MKRPGWLWLVLAALLAAGAAVRAAGAAVGLARIPAEVRQARRAARPQQDLHGIRVARLGPAGVADTLDLGSIHRGVVFAFSPRCETCNRNMWNWLDVAAALRDRPGVLYAITVDPPDTARAYWTGLEDRVQVLVTDTAVMRRLRVGGPPETLGISDGILRWKQRSLMDPGTKQEVIAWARRTPR